MQKWNGQLLRKFDDPTEGNASVGTTVVVRNTSDNSLAVIYDVDDVNSVQKNNPFVTDDFGRYSFYAPSGKYTVEFGDGSDAIDITLLDNIDNIAKTYFNVEEMLLSNTLLNGETAHTINYSVSGDGGGATYVRDDLATADEYVNHTLPDGGVMKLDLSSGVVLLEQCGAKSDQPLGEIFQSAFNTGLYVTTNLKSLILDKIAYSHTNYQTIDMNGARCSWIGNYDVYAQFGGRTLKNDRNIGIINLLGERSDVQDPILSVVDDGVSAFEVTDGSIYESGEYVLLNAMYPRRAVEVTVMARVMGVTGNIVDLDYTAGWRANSATLEKCTPIIGSKVINFNYTDNSGATELNNKVAGVGTLLTTNCKVSNVEASNFAYPMVMHRIGHWLNTSELDALNPRFVDAGQGYVCQFNNCTFSRAKGLRGTACRHVWDFTSGGHNEVEDCHAYDPILSTQFGFHGAYEHDILCKNTNQTKGSNSITIADAGSNFGDAAIRITFDGGKLSGRIKSQNASKVSWKNIKFLYGNYDTNEIEMGCNQGLTIDNCTFPYNTLVRARVRADGFGEQAGDIVIRNSTLPKEFRVTYSEGDLIINDSTVYSLGNSGTPYLQNIYVKGGKIKLNEGSFGIHCNGDFKIDGVQVTQPIGVSNSRIKGYAKNVSAFNSEFKGGTGFFASGGDSVLGDSLKSYTLSNVIAEGEPLATSAVFNVENAKDTLVTIDCVRGYIDPAAYNNAYIFDVRGADGDNVDINIKMSNSYIDGRFNWRSTQCKSIQVSNSTSTSGSFSNNNIREVTAVTVVASNDTQKYSFSTPSATMTLGSGLSIGHKNTIIPTASGVATVVSSGGETFTGAAVTAPAGTPITVTKISTTKWFVEYLS